jgi:hypothetical protein
MTNELTRKAILEADDAKMERVEVPEWNGFVFVRTMNGVERGRFEEETYYAKSADGKPDIARGKQRVCVYTCCDAEGNRLFTEPGDIDKLGARDGSAINRIFDAAARINHLTETAIAELQGNSETGRG